MKITIFLQMAFLFCSFNIVAAPVQEVSSAIKEVSVYLNGAQVTRTAAVNLVKGNTVLYFSNLPQNIDPQSIQVKGQGNFTVLSVMHQINYLASQKKSHDILIMEDSLKILEDKLALNNSMLSVYKSEEELLIANREIGSAEKGIVVSELKLAADFLRSRMTEIKKEQLSIARQNLLLNEKIDKLHNQLNTLNSTRNKPVSEILVSVEAPSAVNGSIKVIYTVFNAGWIPVYDIRAVDVGSPVSMIYNAKVYQQTGEDWENVRLKLSTANPHQRGDKPNLTSWYLNFNEVIGNFGYENVIMSDRARKAEMAMPVMAEAAPEMDMIQTASTAADYTNVVQQPTNLEFSIKIPYDIPSDNKQYTINIQEYKLPALFQYYCAPKLDRDAFLIARITGWENYNLLSGDINLFFEDSYVGKSFLNIRNTSDTLDLSLGRDKSIVVTRVRLTDFTADKVLGNTRQETRGWEITARNTKKQPVRILIEDLFPVSMNKEIQVEELDFSGGDYNKETGKIQWLLTLEPAQEKKLKAAFQVKYPKDKAVSLD